MNTSSVQGANNDEIVKGLTSALEDFKHGRYTKISSDTHGKVKDE